MNPQSSCDGERLVGDHFRGQASLNGERRLRTHLGSCAACRELYHRHLLLAAVDPGGAVPRKVRIGRGLGLMAKGHGERSRLRAWGRWAFPAAALAMGAVLIFGRAPTRQAELMPRGQPLSSQLLVYEVPAYGRVHPVTSQMERDSSLAFAYANISHRRHLLVFAVDEQRRVYWYYPAWSDGRENPKAVPIGRDDVIHELPQAIFHRVGGPRLELFGVFCDEALSVRDMEASVARAERDQHGRLLVTLAEADVIRIELAISEPK